MAPEDHNTPGALSRDPECPACRHSIHLLPCDWCLCDDHRRNGLDF